MTNFNELANEYEAGLRKMEAAGYEEFAEVIPKHKLVVAALRTADRPWELIRTAPKDGTPILVFRPDSFASGFSAESGIDVVWWDNGSWQTVGDAITVDLPTHWMPLPRSPAASQQHSAQGE